MKSAIFTTLFFALSLAAPAPPTKPTPTPACSSSIPTPTPEPKVCTRICAAGPADLKCKSGWHSEQMGDCWACCQTA